MPGLLKETLFLFAERGFFPAAPRRRAEVYILNIKEKAAVGALVLSIAAAAAVAVFADGYDTQSDPLVTVSYVQAMKQDMRSEFGIDTINNRISELSSSIIALEQTQARQAQELQQIKLGVDIGASDNSHEDAASSGESGDAGSGAQTSAGSQPAQQTIQASAEYEVVHLINGQVLTADSSLELIPRSGELTAVVTSEANRAAGVGLSDLTGGAEVLHGDKLGVNHYILIPRADGRGVEATGDDAYLMVRGEYTIVG